MTARPYVAAYWGPRAEPLDACADRASRFLQGLAGVDPALGEWYETAGRRTDARSRPIAPARESLVELLGAGRNRRDTDHAVIAELGFSMAVWNGREPPVGLRIGCGKHPRTPHVQNAVVLNMPPDGAHASLFSRETARASVELLVECWAPDWATWTTHEWREEQGAADGEPVLGWMTWFAGKLRPNRLPSGVVLEDVGAGTLVVAAEELGGVTGRSLSELRETLLNSGGQHEPSGVSIRG